MLQSKAKSAIKIQDKYRIIKQGIVPLQGFSVGIILQWDLPIGEVLRPFRAWLPCLILLAMDATPCKCIAPLQGFSGGIILQWDLPIGEVLRPFRAWLPCLILLAMGVTPCKCIAPLQGFLF
jgi:hypothetical protein